MTSMQYTKLNASLDATSRLRSLQQRTGLTPNLLCRIAAMMSLEDGPIGLVRAPDDKGKEFNSYTLTADLTFYANGATNTEWEALRAFRGVAEGDMIRYAIPKREPLLVEHERFRDAVEGKDNDIVTLRQGMRTVEVAAAVLQSARDGVTVAIPATAA